MAILTTVHAQLTRGRQEALISMTGLDTWTVTAHLLQFCYNTDVEIGECYAVTVVFT